MIDIIDTKQKHSKTYKALNAKQTKGKEKHPQPEKTIDLYSKNE